MKKRFTSKLLHSIFLRALVFLSLFIFFAAGCGGGSDSDDRDPQDNHPYSQVVLEGVFIDSPVQGLKYETTTQKGGTDSAGKYKYLEGETITFSVGSIILGSCPAKPFLTPIDLVEGTDNPRHPTVTNICRFLQTLDIDGNSDNGIHISSVIHDHMADLSIDFSQSIENFESCLQITTLIDTLNKIKAFTDGSHELISESDAQIHLIGSLYVDRSTDDDNDGYNENEGDCDDHAPDINPKAIDIPYDGIDQDCSGSDLKDMDNDGFDSAVFADGVDCDDNDTGINPAADEIPNDGIDQDCDGQDFTDADDDGYESIAAGGMDCDDNDENTYPGATEICGDGIDQDCDGIDPVQECHNITLTGSFTAPDGYDAHSEPVFVGIIDWNLNLQSVFNDPLSYVRYYEKIEPGQTHFDFDLYFTGIAPGDKVMVIAFWDKDYNGTSIEPTEGDGIGYFQNKDQYILWITLEEGQNVVEPSGSWVFNINKYFYNHNASISFKLSAGDLAPPDLGFPIVLCPFQSLINYEAGDQVIMIAVHGDAVVGNYTPVTTSIIDIDYIIGYSLITVNEDINHYYKMNILPIIHEGISVEEPFSINDVYIFAILDGKTFIDPEGIPNGWPDSGEPVGYYWRPLILEGIPPYIARSTSVINSENVLSDRAVRFSCFVMP